MRLFTQVGRTALLAAAFVTAFAGISAAQVKPKLKYVAVVNTEIDESAAKTVKSAGARQITDMLRREATNTLLKKDGYNVMTSETVQSQLGGKLDYDCAEENCMITLGSKIGADYIVRGIISTLDKDLTLTVEIYETEDGFLIASNGYLISSPNISGLVKEATNACSQMYKIFAEIVKDTESAPKSEPEPVAQTPKAEPEPAPVAQTPKIEPAPIVQTPKAESSPAAPTPKSEPELAARQSAPETAARNREPESKVQSRVKVYAVNVYAAPVNGGRVSSSDKYSLEGNVVTVTATPNKGYRFAGWEGADVGMANPLDITMNGNKTLTAKFLPEAYFIPFTLTINNANPINGGQVSRSPDLTEYTQGTTVTVTAKPNSGYVFKRWSGAAAGATNPVEITMDGNKTLTAIFDTKNITKIDKTVKIGNQTWMAENLNIPTSSGSWCYGNDDSNCAKYGRLYDWYTAKTACPTGWRLPSNQDWNALVTTAGGSSAGKNLKSTARWPWGGRGADSFGFSALPGGARYTGGGFGDAGSNGYWWTSTESGGGSAYRRRIDYDNDRVGELAIYPENKEDFGKRFGFSVRCLMDN